MCASEQHNLFRSILSDTTKFAFFYKELYNVWYFVTILGFFKHVAIFFDCIGWSFSSQTETAVNGKSSTYSQKTFSCAMRCSSRWSSITINFSKPKMMTQSSYYYEDIYGKCILMVALKTWTTSKDAVLMHYWRTANWSDQMWQKWIHTEITF